MGQSITNLAATSPNRANGGDDAASCVLRCTELIAGAFADMEV